MTLVRSPRKVPTASLDDLPEGRTPRWRQVACRVASPEWERAHGNRIADRNRRGGVQPRQAGRPDPSFPAVILVRAVKTDTLG